MDLEHGNCVSIDGAGVLIRGASGSGKSDLSLRLIDSGAVLVADDYTNIRRSGDQAIASAPEKIAGHIEVRGLGLAKLPYIKEAPVILIVDLLNIEAEERMPEATTVELAGVKIPQIGLWGLSASAPAKIRLAMARINRNNDE